MKGRKQYLDLIETKAHEHYTKYGKTAELDFGGGANWMFDIIYDDIEQCVNQKVVEESIRLHKEWTETEDPVTFDVFVKIKLKQ